MNLLENKNVRLSLAGLLILAIGSGIGWFSKPTSVVTEIKEKEVIKYVETKKEKKNVVTTTKKRTNVDGSIDEESKTEDKSVTDTNVNASSVKEKNTKTVVTNQLGLSLNLLAFSRELSLRDPEFGLLVTKRVLGNISLGIMATTDKSAGVSIGLQF